MTRMTTRHHYALPLMLALGCVAVAVRDADAAPQGRVFRAGAYAVDVTPEKFPVIVNGGFFPVHADRAHDKLHGRWLILDDGKTRIALCVVDSCVLPRTLTDAVKAQVAKATGIPADHVMISATHTHSAPSLMALLGTPADPDYPAFLEKKLVEGGVQAFKNLAPAKVGWAAVDDFEHTHCRRWVRRPDRMLVDPFGALTVRA